MKKLLCASKFLGPHNSASHLHLKKQRQIVLYALFGRFLRVRCDLSLMLVGLAIDDGVIRRNILRNFFRFKIFRVNLGAFYCVSWIFGVFRKASPKMKTFSAHSFCLWSQCVTHTVRHVSLAVNMCVDTHLSRGQEHSRAFKFFQKKTTWKANKL